MWTKSGSERKKTDVYDIQVYKTRYLYMSLCVCWWRSISIEMELVMPNLYVIDLYIETVQ